MSLKAFHKFFISVAILFCGWLTWSEYRIYTRTNDPEAQLVAGVTAAAVILLVVYFVWFLRKSKFLPP
ncbi:hypothetical protein HY522_09170 [bacterium]|nr:hypothetical protein [bacterium]